MVDSHQALFYDTFTRFNTSIMEIKPPFVFQADAEIVNDVYENHPNYLIEYNENAVKEYCIVYFASNDLYYPNNEIAFSESVIKKTGLNGMATELTTGINTFFYVI